MANENTARDRSNDPLNRGPAQATPASDPLAELARLIGRSELLPQPAREAHPAPPPADLDAAAASNDLAPSEPSYTEPEPAPFYPAEAPAHELRSATDIPDTHQDWPGSPPPDLLSELSAPPPYSPPPVQQYDDPGYASANPGSSYSGSSFPSSGLSDAGLSDPAYSSPAPHAASGSSFSGEGFPGSSFPDPRFQSPSYPSSSSASLPGSGFASPGFSDFPHRELPRSNFQASNYADVPRSGLPLRSEARVSEAPDLPAFIPPNYATASDRQDHEPMFPPDSDTSGMPPPHDDDFYDDEPRSGRRRGMLTVFAVLGLAVLGTAGAFGYRSMFSGTRTAVAPPVIRASTEPSKVAPPPSAADPSAGKFSYDRFGDAGKDEKVLKREEKPVDLAKVTPPPPAPTPAPASSSVVTQSSGNPPSAIGEPRRVRTVPIRPDQGGDVATAPPAQQPSTVTPRQAAASTRVASRTPALAANAPLSLSPDANNAPAAAPEPQARALPPAAPTPPQAPRAAPAPAPARVATAPTQAPAQTSAIGGGYSVQVTSQRSQADAESAYRGMQAKYPSVLANQRHQVRRADLGAKGTYYRAMVGPFGTREAAVQLCTNLKQAGGDCVVQH
jgi:hypothetical protein